MSLARQKDIALLLLKYGRGDLIESTSIYDEIRHEDVDPADDGPAELAADLEAMGPTFVKLGQVLASRSDIFPPAYIEALERLQDHVEPFSGVEAREVFEEEMGVKVSNAFDYFEDEPLSAASLAQVHRATMRDGRRVVVKIQRPGIRGTIDEDLEALSSMAGFAEKHTDLGRRLGLTEVVEEFERTLLRELDFGQEARNLAEIGQILADYENLVVPRPVFDFSGGRVLTMDYIVGTSIGDVSPVAMLEMDRGELAEDVLRAYLDQILVHGTFHADPHPGNVLLTEDGRLALVDMGMVARFDEPRRQQLLRLLLAMAEGEAAEVAKLTRSLATPLVDADPAGFEAEVSELVLQHHGRRVRDMATGQLILEVVRIGVEHSMQPPPDLSTLGKTLSYIDDLVRTLDPDCYPDEVVKQHAESLMQDNLLSSLSPGNLFAQALEMHEFARQLPERLNTITEQLTTGEFEVKVDAFNEIRLVNSLEKIANRITLGLVLAALIIGAGLIMHIETDFRIFGYPGIAMILFLAAAALGLLLVITIARKDYWAEPKA